jgi:hypothetical protein
VNHHLTICIAAATERCFMLASLMISSSGGFMSLIGCAVLCCTVLCTDTHLRAVLCCTVQCCAALLCHLPCSPPYSVMYYALTSCTTACTVRYNILCCVAQCFDCCLLSAPFCTVLRSDILYLTVLYWLLCTVCIVLFYPMQFCAVYTSDLLFPPSSSLTHPSSSSSPPTQSHSHPTHPHPLPLLLTLSCAVHLDVV